MVNFSALDRCLKRYLKEVKTWSPDRLIDVNLSTLKDLEMLTEFHQPSSAAELTRYFQVSESADKITLVNNDFVIWIVPEMVDKNPTTYVFIALNRGKRPSLEISFSAKGVYNSSKLIMRVIEKMLNEIQENEDLISRYTNRESA